MWGVLPQWVFLARKHPKTKKKHGNTSAKQEIVMVNPDFWQQHSNTSTLTQKWREMFWLSLGLAIARIEPLKPTVLESRGTPHTKWFAMGGTTSPILNRNPPNLLELVLAYMFFVGKAGKPTKPTKPLNFDIWKFKTCPQTHLRSGRSSPFCWTHGTPDQTQKSKELNGMSLEMCHDTLTYMRIITTASKKSNSHKFSCKGFVSGSLLIDSPDVRGICFTCFLSSCYTFFIATQAPLKGLWVKCGSGAYPQKWALKNSQMQHKSENRYTVHSQKIKRLEPKRSALSL